MLKDPHWTPEAHASHIITIHLFLFSVLAIKSIFPLIQASYRTCVNQQNGQNELLEILESRL